MIVSGPEEFSVPWSGLVELYPDESLDPYENGSADETLDRNNPVRIPAKPNAIFFMGFSFRFTSDQHNPVHLVFVFFPLGRVNSPESLFLS